MPGEIYTHVAVPGGESDISFVDKHLLTILCGGDQLREQGGTRASNKIQIQVNDWMGSCQYLKIGMVIFLEVSCVVTLYMCTIYMYK